jgi:hypothetical protein
MTPVKTKNRTRILIANAQTNLKLALSEETLEGQQGAFMLAKKAIDDALAYQTASSGTSKPSQAKGSA